MKTWQHKQYPKRTYTGKYVVINGVRHFRLSTKVKVLLKTRVYHVTFRSWQEAIKKGWERI
jgi:hypothetical protein